jgi:transporter family-2 protein
LLNRRSSLVHELQISFPIGTAALLAYILMTKQTVSWTGIKQLPPQYWIGGILGATYVSIVILVFPKLGPGLAFSLIVAGQMAMALFLEHYNILVAQQQPVSLGRIMGVVLIVVGVVFLKRF